MTKILIERADGGVSVMMLLGGASQSAELAKWRSLHGSAPASVTTVDDERIPADRTFRNAWRSNGDGTIAVHMPAARNIQRDRIRAKRPARFVELDRLHYVALTAGTVTVGNGAALIVGMAPGSYTASQIEARKQALRDAPQHPDIETATTPEALKNLWPAGLE